MNTLGRPLLALSMVTILSGCATTGATGSDASARNPVDPFERFNRTMFTFNDKVDQYALKPAAIAYKRVVPSFMQTGVYNFFGNLGDVWTAVNNLLQGRVADGVSDVMRFTINSTFGLAGLIDISSDAGLPKHNQDFGATLGVWGVQSGPYVVLPLLGSSTVRDSAALPADFAGNPWTYVSPDTTRYLGTALRVIDLRAGVLDASNLIEDAALDRYEFIRDAYLQRRANKISSNRERGADSVYRALPDDEDLDSKTDNGSSLNGGSAAPSAEPATRGDAQQEKAPAAPAANGSQPAFIPAPDGDTRK
ncbi:VacJ family lipoprotein [Noviherbaspirillum sp. 1P10PC]|uniref:MlaA family lipoprotein n=1 Tax=Noviherbaspirillum sp. 1P10PC TaxID=3132292 RepID=UPI0039A20AFB